jgi:hypothetical protein
MTRSRQIIEAPEVRASTGAEALIKEARQRRRWLAVIALILVVAMAVGIAIGAGVGGITGKSTKQSRLGSTPPPTSIRTVVATCAHNDKTFPATVWTQLVTNGYMVCPVTIRRLTPFSASEAVARDVKNGAIPSTLPPLLARVGSKHGGLVGQPRHSEYWVLIDMPQLPISYGPDPCGPIAPLKGFSFDLVNADTGKLVWSAEWWPQELNLTPAPQYRAAWHQRQIEYEQLAKEVAACRKRQHQGST